MSNTTANKEAIRYKKITAFLAVIFASLSSFAAIYLSQWMTAQRPLL